jgi:hypothetical protein
MNEIKDLIEKTINPPGILKKNRRALFLTIRDIAALIRKDALMAFNAHFPYLADSKKLREHGDALLIPRLPHDTENEYRERVATASFFLMKAGERQYIIGRLEERFTTRYKINEEFLNVRLKVTGLTDDERGWALELPDSLLSPNIYTELSACFRFENAIIMASCEKTKAKRDSQDLFPSGLRYNGRFLCDQGKMITCNGEWICDGAINCAGVISVIGTVFDYYLQEIFCNGRWICNGDKDCSGYEKVYEDEFIRFPILPREYMRDELFVSLKTDRLLDKVLFNDLPMGIKIIHPLVCDGSKMPTCSLCNGSIICDGGYTGFDGRYYRDEISEEVI